MAPLQSSKTCFVSEKAWGKHLFPHVYGLLGLKTKWWFSPNVLLCNPYHAKLINARRFPESEQQEVLIIPHMRLNRSNDENLSPPSPSCIRAGRSGSIEREHVYSIPAAITHTPSVHKALHRPWYLCNLHSITSAYVCNALFVPPGCYYY